MAASHSVTFTECRLKEWRAESRPCGSIVLLKYNPEVPKKLARREALPRAFRGALIRHLDHPHHPDSHSFITSVRDPGSERKLILPGDNGPTTSDVSHIASTLFPTLDGPMEAHRSL